MDATAPTRRHYAGALAVLLGALVMLIGSSIGAVVSHASVDALLGLWFGFLAVQVLVFAVLVAVEYRLQRAHWSMAVPVTIVIAQVASGLSAALVGGEPASNAEASYVGVLF